MFALATKSAAKDSSEAKKSASRTSPVLQTVQRQNSSPGSAFVQLSPLCPCDGGCPRCIGTIQPKLKIGQPNDKYEQEADRIAEQVMRMKDPEVQRSPT